MSNGKILHIYEQPQPHFEALIIGERFALALLRDAINSALAHKIGFGATNVFVNDGEGYTVMIVLVDNQSAETLPVPYSRTDFKERDMSRVAFSGAMVRERIEKAEKS